VADITAYIPAYKVAQFLPRSIESLQAQTLAPVEILVIDDGSPDKSAEIAARYSGVRVVRHGLNKGLAAARNTAFRSARCELVASLDADCAAEPTWLEKLALHLEDARVAGAGGFLVESVQTSLADRWRSVHMRQEWGNAVMENPSFLFGCNNLFRRSAVMEVGGYDETMRTNGEDCDLSRRLLEKNWRLVYDPAARATHLRHDSLGSILDTYWRWWRSGVNAYARGISLRSVVGHALFIHFGNTFPKLWKADLRERRFELLALDALLACYLPYRDFRLWIGSHRNRATEPSAAGV
jgi:cellulose synthase/poly-beta-1,6-N-acetylglucosamine synthase-like glycosyltransferase